ncbi:MAG: hypothetical protein ABIU10_08980 [Sphingomicrobium sp.]
MRRLICKTFGHHRNLHGVRRSGAGWRSTCIVCRTPLIRIAHGDWRLAADPEPAVPDQLVLLALLEQSPVERERPTDDSSSRATAVVDHRCRS